MALDSGTGFSSDISRSKSKDRSGPLVHSDPWPRAVTFNNSVAYSFPVRQESFSPSTERLFEHPEFRPDQLPIK
jgi:hypothetical protein